MKYTTLGLILLLGLFFTSTVYGVTVLFKPSQPQNVREPVASEDLVGNDRDDHNCIGSAGYMWCEEKQKCLRDWEEPCGEEEAFKVLSALKAGEEITFSGIGRGDFQWQTKEGVQIVSGREMSAEEPPAKTNRFIAAYFKNQGFTPDTQNTSGYVNPGLVCLVYASSENGTTVSCGSFQDN